jgi:hypothetical protein
MQEIKQNSKKQSGRLYQTISNENWKKEGKREELYKIMNVFTSIITIFCFSMLFK